MFPGIKPHSIQMPRTILSSADFTSDDHVTNRLSTKSRIKLILIIALCVVALNIFTSRSAYKKVKMACSKGWSWSVSQYESLMSQPDRKPLKRQKHLFKHATQRIGQNDDAMESDSQGVEADQSYNIQYSEQGTSEEESSEEGTLRKSHSHEGEENYSEDTNESEMSIGSPQAKVKTMPQQSTGSFRRPLIHKLKKSPQKKSSLSNCTND